MTQQTLNDEEFHEQAKAGGASRHAVNNTVPDRGYMVGGARDLSDQPFPETSEPVDRFNIDHVRHHIRAIRDAFGSNSTVHQGAWAEGSKVVLDASEKFDNKLEAKTVARSRGERAVYGVEEGKDLITAPGAHKAGARKATAEFPATPTADVGGARKYQGKHIAGTHKATVDNPATLTSDKGGRRKSQPKHRAD